MDSRVLRRCGAFGLMLAPALLAAAGPAQAPTAEPSCERLVAMPNVTITRAAPMAASNTVPAHCYIQGTIAGRIRFHMQLPSAANWNGRLLNIGDGGKDGQLDFADHRLAQGYAVANSNTGHDNGSEPRASYRGNGLLPLKLIYGVDHVNFLSPSM